MGERPTALPARTSVTEHSSPPSQSLLHPSLQTATVRDQVSFKAPTFKDGELVLYFHPYNFYSQKVFLMLYEKNIDFTPYAIDLLNGEQYSTWFLRLNPKGDVPVLQDGAIVVSNSTHIINYVENKFRGDGIVELRVHAVNSLDNELIHEYEQVLAQVPVGALSLGSFLHDDLKLAPKSPFIGPVRKSCLTNNDKVYDILKRALDNVEETTNRAVLLGKLELQDRRKRLVYSRSEFQKVLDRVHDVLRFFEREMQQRPDSEWLVAHNFTLADISFGLLLHRLYQLGFENYYWTYGKLPRVESYFLRFRKRTAYQRLMPSNFDILRDMWQKTPTNYKIGAGAGVLSMAMFAALAHK